MIEVINLLNAPNGYSLRVVGVPQSIGDCANCIHLYPASPEARAHRFLGSQSCDPHSMASGAPALCGRHESNPGPKPTLKTLLKHTHSILPTLTLPSPLTHIYPIPSAPLQNIPQSIYYIQLHTLKYLKRHTGPLGRVVPLLARWKGRLAGLP